MSGADVAVSAAEDPSHKTESRGEGSWLHRFVLDKLRVFLQPSILLLLLGASMRHTGQLWDDLGTALTNAGSICEVCLECTLHDLCLVSTFRSRVLLVDKHSALLPDVLPDRRSWPLALLGQHCRRLHRGHRRSVNRGHRRSAHRGQWLSAIQTRVTVVAEDL